MGCVTPRTRGAGGDRRPAAHRRRRGRVLRQGAEALAVPLAEILRQLPDPTNLDDITTAIDDYLTQFLQGALSQSLSAQDAQSLAALDPEVTITKICGDHECDPGAGDTLANLTDISALVTFGQEVVAGTGINLGLEGLPLSIEAGIEGFAEWSLTVGAGVSRDDGPYIKLDPAADEVSVTAGVRFNDQGPSDSPVRSPSRSTRLTTTSPAACAAAWRSCS